MRMKFVGMLAACLILAAGGWMAADGTKPAVEGDAAEVVNLYVCACGPDCKCGTVATAPGKYTCGKELTALHILKIDQGSAALCTCGKGCTCALDAKDPSKCGCGKPVKTVSLKGLYVCACGPTCTCNTVSAKPGKCRCGKDLKQVS